MPIKSYKPTSPGTRFRTVKVSPELSNEKPLKALTEGKNRINGRGSKGQTICRAALWRRRASGSASDGDKEERQCF